MDSNNCTRCKKEEKIEDFYNEYTECKICNCRSSGR